MSNSEKLAYNRQILKDRVTKNYIDTGLLNEETIKEYLENGLEVKASGEDTLKVEVVQLEQDGVTEHGRELFYLSATIDPKNDINEEGYVTHAWFDMPWIHNIEKMTTGGYKARMKPAYFRLSNPIKCFRCYIDGVEKRLLPDPRLEDSP